MKSKAENNALACQSNPFFIDANLNLEAIRNKLEKILAHIGEHDMFSEYTKHDITHVDGVLSLLDHIIPSSTAAKLTAAEWMLIVLSAYFHDFGLLITNDEFETRNENPKYMKYVNDHGLRLGNEKKERKYYENFVRIHHGDRIHDWIMGIHTEQTTPCVLLNEMIGQLSEGFLESLALICRSHQEDDLPEKLFVTDKQFAQDESTRANLLYCAVAIRTGDLLHINSERTPLIEYKIINPRDPRSQIEWLKQLAIQSVLPRKEKPMDDLRNTPILPHAFEIQGKFKKPDAYFAFCEYCKYASKQLKISKQWCLNNHPEGDNPYEFPWDDIDVSRVETEGFHREKLRFEVDKENILKLLTGHTLYNNSTVVIRELIQNALDAGRCQSAQSKRGDAYRPKVQIHWDSSSRLLSVSDNGTGMTMDTIKNFLLKVGVSKYQSEEFKNEFPSFHSISRFGIGLLTCFMISDDIDIFTLEKKEKICHHLMIRNLVGEYLLCENDGMERILENEHGTVVELKVRPGIKIDNLESILKEWVLVPGAEVTLFYDDSSPVSIGYGSVEECLKGHMEDLSFYKDKQDYYSFKTTKIDGMEVSYLVSLDANGKISNLARVGDVDLKSFPFGMAIEGIRVTKTTPGFLDSPFFVMVNFTGNDSPTTNVARDDIEQNAQSELAIKKVYSEYVEFYRGLLDDSLSRYSIIWAARETSYLINSFLSSRGRRLSDSSLFEDSLSDGKFLIVDDGNKYSLSSFNQIGQVIYTIGGNGYEAANRLLLDCNTSETSALSVLRNLHGTSAVDGGKYLYINNLASIFKDLFQKKYNITEIHIDREHRQTVLKWEKGISQWKSFDPEYRHMRDRDSVLFPLNPQSVCVSGDDGEIAIRTSVGMIFNPNSSFIQNLVSFINTHSWTDFREAKVFELLSILISERDIYEDIPDDIGDRFFQPFDECSWSSEELLILKGIFNNIDVRICDFSLFYHK